jgi:hypothetical protein
MAFLTLNLSDGAVSFNFALASAQTLKAKLIELVQLLKSGDPQNPKPTRKENFEYQYSGDIFLEVFCNPNIYPNPFAAKVLLTIRDEQIKVTAEADLSQVLADLEDFIQ